MLHPMALYSECTFLRVQLWTDESSEQFQGGFPFFALLLSVQDILSQL